MMQVVVKDLDNNSSNAFHRGRIIEADDLITYPIRSVIIFNNTYLELLHPNDENNDLKSVEEVYIK